MSTAHLRLMTRFWLKWTNRCKLHPPRFCLRLLPKGQAGIIILCPAREIEHLQISKDWTRALRERPRSNGAMTEGNGNPACEKAA